MTNYDIDELERQGLIKSIENPNHYNKCKIEPLEYIIQNKLDFLQGNIVKYVTRYPYKGGYEDLIKARKYLDKLIEREYEFKD